MPIEQAAQLTGMVTVDGRPIRYSTHPIGQGLGIDVTDLDATMLVEGPITFDWHGEQGQGWMERLARVNGHP